MRVSGAQVVLPDSHAPPPDFSPMAEAYIGGMNLVMPFGLKLWSVKAVIAVNYWCLGQPVGKLSCADWLRFWLTRLLFLIIRWAPGFERIMSFILLLAFRLLPPPPATHCPCSGAPATSGAKCPVSAPQEEASSAVSYGLKCVMAVAILLVAGYMGLLCSVLACVFAWACPMLCGGALVLHGMLTAWLYHVYQLAVQ